MARDASCNAPQAKPLSSFSVNQYRWINIWTSILGQALAGLPVFFCHFALLRKAADAIFIA
ncbi:MAG TPA: DUF2684 domain-containing protein [Serratia sp.]|nr:DUF2684 domain-containing protein [Serratia sp. (in: enterobacteria)]